MESVDESAPGSVNFFVRSIARASYQLVGLPGV
jgi:hypothetical protein